MTRVIGTFYLFQNRSIPSSSLYFLLHFPSPHDISCTIPSLSFLICCSCSTQEQLFLSTSSFHSFTLSFMPSIRNSTSRFCLVIYLECESYLYHSIPFPKRMFVWSILFLVSFVPFRCSLRSYSTSIHSSLHSVSFFLISPHSSSIPVPPLP